MQLIRTNEVMTAGITNIPLTYPAKVFFFLNSNQDTEIDIVYSLFKSMNIEIERNDFLQLQKVFFTTQTEVKPAALKVIWRNFKTLRPKFRTNFRYVFWEIDDNDYLDNVLDIYRYFKLPVIVKTSGRGYHFMSIKPVDKDTWHYIINQLVWTNNDYPPITIRIKPNKYVNEELKSWVIGEKYHSDSVKLCQAILKQDFEFIQENYQLVWYRLDAKPTNQYSYVYENEV